MCILCPRTGKKKFLEASVPLPAPGQPYDQCEVDMQGGGRLSFSLRTRHLRAAGDTQPAVRELAKNMSALFPAAGQSRKEEEKKKKN